MNKLLKEAIKKWDKHVEESKLRCLMIETNSQFRKGAIAALWVIYVAVIGALVKIFYG